MAAQSTAAAPGQERRPWFGLRHTPGRLALTVFRMPLFLYRHGWGRLLGRTFLLLVHVGRKTGQPHEMVAMVLGDDRHTGEVVICSGWGPDAAWLRNLHAQPAKLICIGSERFNPEHRFLSEDEAVQVIAGFRARHPRRVRLITAILGWGDLRDDDDLRWFVATHPFVAFRPLRSSEETEDRR
ncbi:MAG TPA: nitroreductase family deazaflavin-dependent oxidoreductase [Jatrophihabitantaceae bacterium]|nr:nitroreductase family deazaflavin-dependent oxidoreductase [Jatrophihabitantaceae bacterium]